MNNKTKRNKAFTLAEVLITLTIIGVVAALTIPSLLADISEKTYEAKRKALQVRLTQAFAQIGSLNAYEDEDDPEKNSSMKFVTEALSKVYKISNICEYDNFAGCDFPATFASWHTSTQMWYTKNFKHLTGCFSGIATAANLGGFVPEGVALRSKNGESMLFWYNPRCVAEQNVEPGGNKLWTKEICAAMLIDLDGGNEGPNTMGKDIYYGLVLYPDVPYLLIVSPFHGTAAAEVASYSDSTNPEDNIEGFCMNEEVFGKNKGSFVAPAREQTYALQLFWAAEGNHWTSNIEGSGPDDYGWVVGSEYVYLQPRNTIVSRARCVPRQ